MGNMKRQSTKESWEKVRRKWRKGGCTVGTRSKLKMMCCVFVCECGSHINPAISQVQIIFPCGGLCECVYVYVYCINPRISLSLSCSTGIAHPCIHLMSVCAQTLPCVFA